MAMNEMEMGLNDWGIGFEEMKLEMDYEFREMEMKVNWKQKNKL